MIYLADDTFDLLRITRDNKNGLVRPEKLVGI
jgi:hypothetical protein